MNKFPCFEGSEITNFMNKKGLIILRAIISASKKTQNEKNLNNKGSVEISSKEIKQQLNKIWFKIDDCQFYRYLRTLAKNNLIEVDKKVWKDHRNPIRVQEAGIEIIKVLRKYFEKENNTNP